MNKSFLRPPVRTRLGALFLTCTFLAPYYLYMCVVFWTTHDPDYSLILLANRDEFLQRPAKPATWRALGDRILCGIDEVAGGTWVGMSSSGAISALTNVYEFPQVRTTADGRPLQSRGELVKQWLQGHDSPTMLDHMYASRHAYGAFNLLLGRIKDGRVHMSYLTNRPSDAPIRTLQEPNVCGLSNSSPNDPWPKVRWGEVLVEDVLARERHGEAELLEKLFEVLQSTSASSASQEDLPRLIHVPPMRMPSSADGTRLASAQEVHEATTGWYGTRTSTMILVSRAAPHRAVFVERDCYTLHNNEPRRICYADPVERAKHERYYEWELTE